MLRTLTLAITTAVCLAAPGMAQERTMIVLDGSGSMWGQIGGRTKIEIARETLASVLGGVPADRALGLMVYGHRRKGDCADIELAVPAAPGQAGVIGTFASGVTPTGKTPLSEAVRQAAAALRYDEAAATVILVTDGIETCHADPCALGRELERAGVNFTAHVVGFGLSRDEGKAVACLATETGGTYIEARDGAALGRALDTAMATPVPPPPPEPEPPSPYTLIATAALVEGGAHVDGGALRWDLFPIVDGAPARRSSEGGYNGPFAVAAAPGDYMLKVRLGEAGAEMPVTLTEGALREVHLVLNAGIVSVNAARVPEGDPDNNIGIEVRGEGGVRDSGFGAIRVVMPAGPATVRARHAGARVEQAITVIAGETLGLDLVVGTGGVRPSARLVAGAPDLSGSSLRFDVVKLEQKASGRDDDVGGTYGANVFDVPVGSYRLRARLGEAIAYSEVFDVIADQVVAIDVVLRAGYAEIAAPGVYRINVYTSEDGNRGANLEVSYEPQMVIALAAGNYIARLTYKDDRGTVDLPFVVGAGATTKVSAE